MRMYTVFPSRSRLVNQWYISDIFEVAIEDVESVICQS